MTAVMSNVRLVGVTMYTLKRVIWVNTLLLSVPPLIIAKSHIMARVIYIFMIVTLLIVQPGQILKWKLFLMKATILPWSVLPQVIVKSPIMMRLTRVCGLLTVVLARLCLKIVLQKLLPDWILV